MSVSVGAEQVRHLVGWREPRSQLSGVKRAVKLAKVGKLARLFGVLSNALCDFCKVLLLDILAVSILIDHDYFVVPAFAVEICEGVFAKLYIGGGGHVGRSSSDAGHSGFDGEFLPFLETLLMATLFVVEVPPFFEKGVLYCWTTAVYGTGGEGYACLEEVETEGADVLWEDDWRLVEGLLLDAPSAFEGFLDFLFGHDFLGLK